MYKTHLYHAKPIIPYTVKSGQAIDLYHGLNQIFAIENESPLYNGPISTTAERSVAHKFSNGQGLLWYINHNYYNPYRIITGLDVTKISQYKGESEILLNNQHITISNTINFSRQYQEMVDQLLYQLQIYQNKIKDMRDINNFWNSIGLEKDEIMENQDIQLIISNHPLLLKAVDGDKQHTRMHDSQPLQRQWMYHHKLTLIINHKTKIHGSQPLQRQMKHYHKTKN